MSEYTNYINKVKNIHQSVAQEVFPNISKVYCKTYKNELEVDPAYCLAHGWPKCCGYTMTIDTPEKWNKNNE